MLLFRLPYRSIGPGSFEPSPGSHQKLDTILGNCAERVLAFSVLTRTRDDPWGDAVLHGDQHVTSRQIDRSCTVKIQVDSGTLCNNDGANKTFYIAAIK